MAREMAGELVREPARIGGGRGAGTGTEGRRGTERHDLDRLAADEEPCRTGQRAIKAHLLNRHRACGWARGGRGGCQRGRDSDRSRRLRPRRKQRNYACRRDGREDNRATAKDMAMHDVRFVPAGSFLSFLTTTYSPAFIDLLWARAAANARRR